jgi:hypothetical protein
MIRWAGRKKRGLFLGDKRKTLVFFLAFQKYCFEFFFKITALTSTFPSRIARKPSETPEGFFLPWAPLNKQTGLNKRGALLRNLIELSSPPSYEETPLGA